MAITNAASGKGLVNGLSFHLAANAAGEYNPRVWRVPAGATIQGTIDAAKAATGTQPRTLILVPPGVAGTGNAQGAYMEQVIISYPLSLQGVGPGGVVAATGQVVFGTVLNALVNTPTWTAQARAVATALCGAAACGNKNLYSGAAVTVFGNAGLYTAAAHVTLDGFTITGGTQGGAARAAVPARATNGVVGQPDTPEVVGVQGGGVFLHAYARFTRITNNVIASNGGTYGGGVRVGTPLLDAAVADSHNDHIYLARNRILGNGGSNLAGNVALFAGAARYQVEDNFICGGYSAEYGGGVSHVGLSPNGRVWRNRIVFNTAFDEGGGVMVMGENPLTPTTLSAGAGNVDIVANIIQVSRVQMRVWVCGCLCSGLLLSTSVCQPSH